MAIVEFAVAELLKTIGTRLSRIGEKVDKEFEKVEVQFSTIRLEIKLGVHRAWNLHSRRGCSLKVV